MGRVANEKHPALLVIIQAQAVRLVQANPIKLPRRGLADPVQMLRNPAFDALLLQLGDLIGVIVQLVVDAPDVAGHLVHQHGVAGIGRWIKPGAPFGRIRRGHLNIGN